MKSYSQTQDVVAGSVYPALTIKKQAEVVSFTEKSTLVAPLLCVQGGSG